MNGVVFISISRKDDEILLHEIVIFIFVIKW